MSGHSKTFTVSRSGLADFKKIPFTSERVAAYLFSNSFESSSSYSFLHDKL